MKQNETIQSEAWQGFPVSRGSLAGDKFASLFQGDENEMMQKVEDSITYMIEHINQPLQVATLAALANVSPSHFFALFKRYTGSPPMSYFIRLRMCQAGQLLGSTSARVKEVAAVLGYDDQFYFSRVFRSVYNVPPSQYRVTGKRSLNGHSVSVGRDQTAQSNFKHPMANHSLTVAIQDQNPVRAQTNNRSKKA